MFGTVTTLKQFTSSLSKKLDKYGNYQVDCIYSETNNGKSYWVFDLVGKNGEEKTIKILAIRGSV